jgi:MoxR-like ATPase
LSVTETLTESEPSIKTTVLIEGIEKIIRGKRGFLELCAAGLLAGGHILLEDKPGLGKTTLAKTLARLIGGEEGGLVFKRIQFTPDLLPYDITGVDIFDPKSRTFRFVPGPVFANIVLADEINRAAAKTQSALLEVMAERQVTVGAESYPLPELFFVIATQNPVENEGTFPLPAAQLDRFMLRLSIGYPDRENEIAILNEQPAAALPSLYPAVSLEDFMKARQAAADIYCHDALKAAIVDIAHATRAHKALSLGASPRAALHLLAAAKAYALVKGRAFVTDDDIKALAPAALAHRLILKDARSPSLTADSLVSEICAEVLSKVEPL